jgi:DNA polymerase
VVACLGATAAQALLGRDFKVSQRRGEMIQPVIEGRQTTRPPEHGEQAGQPSRSVPYFMATVHPSSISRMPDDQTRRTERVRFTENLTKLKDFLR